MEKMKLSEKQKEVIRLMREGKLIRNWYGGRSDSLTFNDKPLMHKTFSFLNENKLIQRSRNPANTGTTFYELTTLGKTIDL